MQHYTLTLFRKDDQRHELRIFEGEQIVAASPPLAQDEIAPLLEMAKHYNAYAPDLERQGKMLFDWIDRNSGGWLRRVRQTPQPMALSIDVRAGGLRHLPWELLHDGAAYLCADPIHWFTPLRRVSDRNQPRPPQNHQLGILFMVASPENVVPVLGFEDEEAGILQATEHRPLALQVEESGSLEGLRERLCDLAEAPDVLHISGHATVDGDKPVFLLEDDVGRSAPANPDDFARALADSGALPRLVFLSGCRTGQSDAERNVLSFGECTVQAGVPAVLGWALPVGDRAATVAAAALYEKLAAGFSLPEAVAFARCRLYESGARDWHLLRCHTDASPLYPLVGKGRVRVRAHDTQQAFLDAGGIVPVCRRTAFVGRRRLLQRCLRALRARFGDADYAEGVLLHGLGGLGKSSAAARLVDRLRPSHEPVVCYGGLDATVLIAALVKTFPDAAPLLNEAGASLPQRLRKLFDPEANRYTGDRSILLIFDDFEQNVPADLRAQGRAEFSPASLAALHAVLQAIRDSGSDVRVVVTSRFAVPVTPPYRLYRETPETLREADLNKKLAQLPNLNGDRFSPELRAEAVELSAGNPRLLEWLDKALLDGSRDPEALFSKLAAKQAEFREAVLIEALVDAQPTAARHSLACAALYRLPVSPAVIEALTGDTKTEAQLQTAARFGLVEITPAETGSVYFVSALLDAALAPELGAGERTRLAGQAAQALFDASKNGRTEALALEIVRLAEVGNAFSVATAVGDPLAFSLLEQDRYREAEILCRRILALGEDFRLLTTLARVEQRLGREVFSEHIERAVALLPADRADLSPDLLRECAITSGVHADILQARGQLDKALRIREQEELPVYEKLGDVRSKAVTMGKIADILQARGQLDKALRIREQEELPVYEKLGDVRSKAVTMGQIADILQARGQLDEALRILESELVPVFEKLGDVRSKAVTMGKIADILQARGQLDKALRIREQEELPVYEKLGDVRSKAVTMGKIADILEARGQLDKALRIREQEELPVYEKLGDVRAKAVTMGQIADILQARGQLDEALRILESEIVPVFEKLGDVRAKAITMGKIADILEARGQLDEALRIREQEQLPVYEKLGDVRAKAITMGKIADILEARGQLDKALRILESELVPVFEKLGDVRSLLVGRTNLALLLLQKDADGNRQRIEGLLHTALYEARRLNIPEAGQIEAILRRLGWDGGK